MQLLSVHGMSLRNLYTSGLLILLTFNVGTYAYYTNCEHTYNIDPGTSYSVSPNYPNNYKVGTSCSYKYIAPMDHNILLKCVISNDSTSTDCTTDNLYLYLELEGDSQLRGAEKFCGTGSFKRQSVFSSLVLAYTSDGSNRGTFKCMMTAKPLSFDLLVTLPSSDDR